MDPKGLVLERHRYGTLGPAVHLQDRMQALSVTKDILGKEDTQITMLGPFRDATTQFVPGDFAVLRTRAYDAPSQPSASGTAWNWGRVSAVRSTTTRAPNGEFTHAPYSVLTQGWYDMLGRTKVHVFETRGLPSVGTAFNITDWMSISSTIQGMFGQSAGVILDYMLKQLVRIRLPESLGGGWLSDEIRVVHNTETARMYAREFTDIESVGFGPLMPQVVQRLHEQRSTDIGSLINGMFVPEPMLIEVFPYLSLGGEVQQTFSGIGSSAEQDPNMSQQQQPNVNDIYAAPMTKLGEILGRQPVIVYRIKPFRADPLYSASVSKVSYQAENPEVGYVLDYQTRMFDPDVKQQLMKAREDARAKGTVLLKEDGFFSQQTFKSASCVPLPWDHVTSLSRQRADTERINAATIHVAPPSDSQAVAVTAMDGLGLPITIDSQVESHGLRLRVSQWPFFTPAGASSPDLAVFYRAVAAQIMQFYQNAQFFDFGSIATHFAHALKLSEDRTGPNSARTNHGVLLPDIEPGRWFRMSFNAMAGGSEYFGYITSTVHTVQRTPAGNLSANTVLNFMRGHFAEEWDVLNGAVVPLGEVDSPSQNAVAPQSGGAVLGGSNAPTSEVTTAPQPAIGTDARCVFYNPVLRAQFAKFNGGIPVSLEVDGASSFAAHVSTAQRPLWLKCWTLEALNVSAAARTSINNAFDAVGAEAIYANNIWALSACCYVIECYWRIKFPNARLRIASIPRANDGFHGLLAAADFYLERGAGATGERPGALQMWGALFKLIDAGRIPEGGQGLYLNVNPKTGIKGLAPSQAGQPTNRMYAPGASAHTHYDIAGSFGGISTSVRSGPFSWLSVDWIGHGNDQLTLIGSSYQEYVNSINQTRDPAKKKQRLDNLETGGTPSNLDDVLAGIADKGLIRLSALSQATPAPKRVVQLLALRDQTLKAGLSVGVDVEATRVPLRDAIGQYFRTRGRNDTSLHAVDGTVPNALQVLAGLGAINQLGTPVAPTPPPVQVGSVLRYGKFTPAPTANAPFIAVYGGIDVRGRASGTYMYDYITPELTEKNNVYVASSHRVPGVASYDEGFAKVNGTPSKRILYLFSGGELPCRKILEKYFDTFDRVYLVDPFLAQSISTYTQFIARSPSKFVFAYTPIPPNATTNPENGMNQVQLSSILIYATMGMGLIPPPTILPNATPDQLLNAHMQTNEQAVAHMVQTRIILT